MLPVNLHIITRVAENTLGLVCPVEIVPAADIAKKYLTQTQNPTN